MIELFQVIEDNHDRLVSTLLTEIPKRVTAYNRMGRAELRQSVEHLLEAYTDLLVTGEDRSLRSFFKYLAKVRSSQSFMLSDVMRALLCFPPIMRKLLQDEFRMARGDGRKLYNDSLGKIEHTAYDALCLFADIYQDYVKSRITEHNDYIEEQNAQLGVDLSKFILFRG
ncbi:MAG: hypothetical protein CMH56_14585 [Myxococcales bacterium]|nr:hypothetical protein [Myxococcales bacterium]|tara:strand:- start:1335 stop:1841 length:507 start_codon:yes stop_codon:yes gene_type:complete